MRIVRFIVVAGIPLVLAMLTVGLYGFWVLGIPGDPTADYAAGWIRYGMSRPLPPDASKEMRDGYDEHRSDILSTITAEDAVIVVRKPA